MDAEDLTQPAENPPVVHKPPIAIIGMASIFPQAQNLQAYWDNIMRAVDCITEVPSSYWNPDDYYDPDPNAQDKTYCKRGGFIPEIAFDPVEFGLPPKVMEVTDAVQLLSLVVAKQALADAGYEEPQSFDRERTGVILGCSGGPSLATSLTARLEYPVWEKVLKSVGLSDPDVQKIIEKIKLAYVDWQENAFPGILPNVVAGRIANRLDFGGMNCTTDAACASSLSALRIAMNELTDHRADMVISGGVDLNNSHFTFLCFSKTPALSPHQIVRPFDQESDGTLVGEGIGMMVLKRLEDAERDGDKIYAVIRGMGSSSDGRDKSIYAPRVSGQVLALQRAYADAGIAPASVGLLEAHGTGTVAGDITETNALREVFGQNNLRKQHIALGSVKSQIGHTKAAAGAAGLLKVALALHHKVLPPTINIAQPNANLHLTDSPFYLNTHTRPWIQTEKDVPRRAGVSSFGFGGANYHVVLEEYGTEQSQAYRLHPVPQLMMLVAPTPEGLVARCEEVLEQLGSATGAHEYTELVEACQDLEIPPAAARLGFVADSLEEAQQCLKVALDTLKARGHEEAWSHPQGIDYRQSGLDPAGKVVALFSGQGSQYVEMGRTLANNFPILRETYAHIDGLFKAEGLQPVSDVVYPVSDFADDHKDDQAQALRRTDYAQPAIGCFSVGLYKILQQAGFAPDFVVGHSFGELTALWAAEVLSDAAYFTLVKVRGQAMAPPDAANFDAGSMLAVAGDVEQLQNDIQAFPELIIANWNSRKQVALAGPTAAIKQAQQELSAPEKGYAVTLLPVSAAFHTSLVGHAQQPFAQAIEAVPFHKAAIPVYANTTGRPYPKTPKAMRKVLAEHLLKPVLFKQQIENIYADGGRIFVEVGPQSILTSLVKNTLGDQPHLAIALNASSRKDSDRQFRQAVLQLRIAGLPLKNIDPCQLRLRENTGRQQSLATVCISGSGYVSPETKKAFEVALQEEYRVGAASATPADLLHAQASNPSGKAPNPPEQSLAVHDHHVSSSPEVQVTHSPQIEPPLSHLIEDRSTAVPLVSLPSSEEGSQPVHESNRNAPSSPGGQRKSAPHQSQLVPQIGASTQSSASPHHYHRVLTSLERSMQQFHEHQEQTWQAHGEFLQNQAEYAKDFFHLMSQHYQLLGPSLLSTGGLEASSIEIEADTVTLPPVQPSPLDEPVVNGRATAITFPAGATPGPETLTTGISLAPSQPAGPIEPGAGVVAPVMPSTTDPQPAGSEIEPQATEALDAASPIVLDFDTIATTLLEVVSDKTGYPIEMLEVDQDMEADLGIDSIKRVEILGAVKELYPDLPEVEVDLQALAELRTLRQIIDLTLEQITAGSPAVKQLTIAALHDPEVPKQEAHIQRSLFKLQRLAYPDGLEFDPPEGCACMLTDDGTPTTLCLAQGLQERGWSVVVLSYPTSLVLPQTSWPTDIPRVMLTDLSEAVLTTQLDAIADQYGPIGTLIYLQPVSQDDRPMVAKQFLQHALLLAKHLKPSLHEAATLGRSSFFTVTRLDGQFGMGDEVDFSPIRAGLSGLTKTACLEWPTVHCRAIDIHPALDAPQASQSILRELYDPYRGFGLIGYTPQERLTLLPEAAPSIADAEGSDINAATVFLVSGGAKGITAQCVIRLAQAYQCKFILLGRSSITEPEPEWAHGLSDEAQLKRRIMEDFARQGEKPTPQAVQQVFDAVLAKREIAQTLQAIQLAGGQAEYLRVDITDRDALQNTLPEVVERVGPITGIIHGAGVLADKLIEDKSVQDFEMVYAVKVDGLENLLSCVSPDQLDVLVFFSSTSAVYGNYGQSDYAMANETLDKWAYVLQRAHPKCRVLSINWGPWDGGMVSPLLKQLFAQRNIALIPPDIGTQLFVDELRHRGHQAAQMMMSSPIALTIPPEAIDLTLRTHRIQRELSVEASPCLHDHSIAGYPVVPAATCWTWLAGAGEGLYPGFQVATGGEFKVLKGIVLSAETPTRYTVELQEKEKTGDKIVFDGLICSYDLNNGKIRYHYSLKDITLLRQLPPAPTYPHFDRTDADAIPSSTFYEDGTLFHGPGLQGVARILNISREKLTLECVVPEVTTTQVNQFTIQQIIQDIPMQSPAIWIKYFCDSNSLPGMSQTSARYRDLPLDRPFYASCEIERETDTKAVNDIYIHDAEGVLYSKMLGCESIKSSRLNQIFTPNAGDTKQ